MQMYLIIGSSSHRFSNQRNGFDFYFFHVRIRTICRRNEERRFAENSVEQRAGGSVQRNILLGGRFENKARHTTRQHDLCRSVKSRQKCVYGEFFSFFTQFRGRRGGCWLIKFVRAVVLG